MKAFSYKIKFLLFALTLVAISCQNETPKQADDSKENVEKSKKIEPKKDGTPLPNYERLDQVDRSNFSSTILKKNVEGDCEYHYTKHESDLMTFYIDSTDCFDYGQTYTYFLLNDIDEIRMIHKKSATPFIDNKGAFIAIEEVFVSFGGISPKVKIKKDTIPKNPSASKVEYLKNYKSEPWITLSEKSDDLLFGQKIDYSGDWYEESKNKLKNKLSEMEALPRTIPTKNIGTVGMGHRSEWGSMCDEAIQEVAAEREKLLENADPFQRTTKSFQKAPASGDYASIGYWKNIFQNMIK